MKQKNKVILKPKNVIILLLGTLLLLMIPFLAMVLDLRIIDPGNPIPEQVNWSPMDFVVMGVLIFSTGIAFELLQQMLPSKIHKSVLATVLLMVFLLFWAELAVGIVNSPFAGS